MFAIACLVDVLLKQLRFGIWIWINDKTEDGEAKSDDDRMNFINLCVMCYCAIDIDIEPICYLFLVLTIYNVQTLIRNQSFS